MYVSRKNIYVISISLRLAYRTIHSPLHQTKTLEMREVDEAISLLSSSCRLKQHVFHLHSLETSLVTAQDEHVDEIDTHSRNLLQFMSLESCESRVSSRSTRQEEEMNERRKS